jgi:hypothetical protein
MCYFSKDTQRAEQMTAAIHFQLRQKIEEFDAMQLYFSLFTNIVFYKKPDAILMYGYNPNTMVLYEEMNIPFDNIDEMDVVLTQENNDSITAADYN